MFCVSSTASQEEAEGQLRVGRKHVPAGCDAPGTRRTRKGDKLKMHYTGTLASDGSKFDSSLDRNEPFTFTLGQGQVIQGWDRGLNGMCVGEKRRLKIPPHLGYGARGSPPKIPANAWLVFEVECIAIDSPSQEDM